MSMIPNPKKSIAIDFTTNEIKAALDNIPAYFKQKYTFEKKNDILNQYTFGALEFLSLGVHVDINLNFINENKTEITIEIRRKIGAFDTWVEVSKANNHITTLFDAISVLLLDNRKKAKTLEMQKEPVLANTKNPFQLLNIEKTWGDFEKYLRKFLSQFPKTYQIRNESSSNEITITIIRNHQQADDYKTPINTLIIITPTESVNNTTTIQFEARVENDAIKTKVEWNHHNMVISITIKLINKLITDLADQISKAELELQNLQKWKAGRSGKEKEEQIRKQLLAIDALKASIN